MSNTLTHAGAVVFRESDAEVLYLVVSSSDGLNWVLPKGHIEIGESPAEAALRELAEEAGTVGEIAAPLAVHQFKKRDRDATVQYFLVREIGSTESIERRVIRWENESAAHQLLTFAEAKAALLEGAAILRLSEPSA
ncbi:MAG TPA: NUDIX domain-containing protein [Pyrinomonadaceae bacterium]|jgi:8-oxo-dGTP pyrophosphatase MutT (NUDIX family)|nr:NUDIX domain-containing protein [Pyrinomonadaceae bacterium]